LAQETVALVLQLDSQIYSVAYKHKDKLNKITLMPLLQLLEVEEVVSLG